MSREPLPWLLRYKNGDAFALALLPDVRAQTSTHSGQLNWTIQPPLEFNYIIDDNRPGKECSILGYTHERITIVEWETLREFGIPVIRVTIDDDERMRVEI